MHSMSSGLIGLMVGLMVGFTINEFLHKRSHDILLSTKLNHHEGSKGDHDQRHHNTSESQAVSTTPTIRIRKLQEEFHSLTRNPFIEFEKYERILQEKENLLNEKFLEYKRFKSESLNKEEEIKLEINHLDDFIEKLRSFIRQEEDKEAILIHGGEESDTLTMMNILLTSDGLKLCNT